MSQKSSMKAYQKADEELAQLMDNFFESLIDLEWDGEDEYVDFDELSLDELQHRALLKNEQWVAVASKDELITYLID